MAAVALYSSLFLLDFNMTNMANYFNVKPHWVEMIQISSIKIKIENFQKILQIE